MVVAKAGLTGTFLNIAITFMGSGILALPSGVKHAGPLSP
jgi:amino acid permease